MKPSISVVIPAHNEAGFLGGCLEAVALAESAAGITVERIVVLNRCTDGTAGIAERHGCLLVREDGKNLSRIRNAGVAVAGAGVIVTCDADSRMHPGTFTALLGALDSGKFVGGGTAVRPERWSPGIAASLLAILPYLVWRGVSFGLFWFRKEDFEAMGGFDERLISVEDLDFASRLKRFGKRSGRKFGTLFRTPLITSCRKFDQFGDWYFFRNPAFVRRVFRGDDREAADRFWYDARSK